MNVRVLRPTTIAALTTAFLLVTASAAIGAPKQDSPASATGAANGVRAHGTPSKSSVTAGATAASAPTTDTSTPQPKSTADDNGGGSNRSGGYDSTRDGTASKNGSGTGRATGKPCAGCVGKADNKNPRGQDPDNRPTGKDRNNGHECDGNNGIARGNPAHTVCRRDADPPDDPDGPCRPRPGKPCAPPPPDVCVVTATETCSEVLAERVFRTASVGRVHLAKTGVSVAMIGVFGLLFLLAGALCFGCGRSYARKPTNISPGVSNVECS